jgi:hypothetical protein
MQLPPEPCHALRMSRPPDAARHARLVRFTETLPPAQRGLVISVLLGNALLVIAVDGLLAVAVVRGTIRGWQHRRSGIAAAVQTGAGPALCGALAAAVMHRLVAGRLMRAVETGSAAEWLERGERWLTAPESRS